MFIFIVLNNNIPYLNNTAVYKVFLLSSPLVLTEVFEVGLTLLLLLEGPLTLAVLCLECFPPEFPIWLTLSTSSDVIFTLMSSSH